MNNYLPKDGLHVTIFGKQGADKWQRHAYRIPADVGMWPSYRVLIQSYGCTAYCAFLTVAEFKQWLATKGAKVKLQPHRKEGHPPAWVARFGRVEVSA